ncbi:MAG TPA: hypothetical protein VF173_16010 [Thermoanaerobaculia bacterium]|nr:hypothetical protein [Thermoanaerobaculia bacterium]
MRRIIPALTLSLGLGLFGHASFAMDLCTTGCWTYEPCDGYCEDTGVLMGCGDQWAILQECHPYWQSAQSAAGGSETSSFLQELGSGAGTEKGQSQAQGARCSSR